MTTIDISIMNQPAVNEVFDPDNGLWLATLVDQNCMGINPASGTSYCIGYAYITYKAIQLSSTKRASFCLAKFFIVSLVHCLWHFRSFSYFLDVTCVICNGTQSFQSLKPPNTLLFLQCCYWGKITVSHG